MNDWVCFANPILFILLGLYRNIALNVPASYGFPYVKKWPKIGIHIKIECNVKYERDFSKSNLIFIGHCKVSVSTYSVYV